MDARTPAAIAAQFGGEAWIDGALAEFGDRDLMIEMDGQHLSLALPVNANI
jgi:hypothetical protein